MQGHKDRDGPHLQEELMVALENTWAKSLAGKQIDDFVLGDFVGAGNIGYVYKATFRDFPEDGVRAIKLTFDRLRDGWDVELRKVLRLSLHTNIVHFHQSGTATISHDGSSRMCQYTVWDYIPPGENLRQYLARTGAIDAGFLIAVVERVLHVLHSCETEGVPRHGDLHSGNILIGDQSRAPLDDSLQPRAPIYVSDFGYGATGGTIRPKDDYAGLARIINEMIPYVRYSAATATHRQILRSMNRDLGKLLAEKTETERRTPLELLRLLKETKLLAQAGGRTNAAGTPSGAATARTAVHSSNVGQFQVSEMIGERWDWWRRLFVPTVPARSKILALDIPTVVTGPRGCGKTMLFRRLSERLVVECGDVAELSSDGHVAALYVNANDFADAFAQYPGKPSRRDEGRLICYANLCVLGDLLTVQSARVGTLGEPNNDELLALVHGWLVSNQETTLLVGEDRLERYRSVLEEIKWRFPRSSDDVIFPGYQDLSQLHWLPNFIRRARMCCPWLGGRAVLLFIDDFSTPRVSSSMQRVLNRLFLQRSADFLSKIATESWTTFVPQDSSGKVLEDGDDYQLVDIGEEALFLPDGERLAFLTEVFARRLEVDTRVPSGGHTLGGLLGRMNLSKTEFARRLRVSLAKQSAEDQPQVTGRSQRRGRSRGRVHYHGEDVLAALWSGDTRMMIQLVGDIIDQASESTSSGDEANKCVVPVDSQIQDRVFRNRGGEWLNSLTRNEPSDAAAVKAGLAALRTSRPKYSLRGQYGDHLKAIVEAFVSAASGLLRGPMYTIAEGTRQREVPRMAFRIEILDELKLEGLASELYRDLIRYGLFMRDSRGKSVRGAFVPRLYLRRVLLPYCTLALSKRDSVSLSCAQFKQLLLEPDEFQRSFGRRRDRGPQLAMPFLTETRQETGGDYDDLAGGAAGSGTDGEGKAEGVEEQ